MADKHISLPKPFSSGNASDWLKRFEICSTANSWSDEMKAKKLPTLLEGEALAVWLEMTAEDQANYTTVRETLINKMSPEAFVSLDEFHQRKLHPGESVTLYAHELKKLLGQAMPELEVDVRNQLVLHQFMVGLPCEVARQLRATGDTKVLSTTVDRARLLLTLDDHKHVAAVTEGPDKDTVVSELKSQVDTLTEQVAVLTTRFPSSRQ